MTTTIDINCLVIGDSPKHAFPVQIEKSLLVGNLKDIIKKQNSPEFDNIKASNLTLWKVDFPDDDVAAIQQFALKDDKTDDIEMLPTRCIFKYFTKPAEDHIHIMVEPPANTKKVRCKVIYGRNTTTFQWTVSREATTLAELKARLRDCFTFPDGTEDQHIDISHRTGEGKDILVARLLKDAELVSIVWAIGSWVELPLVVDTSQRPFSSWNFAKIKPMFGLTATSYVNLPTFEVKCVDTDEYADEIEHVMKEILRRHTTSEPIAGGSNEASRCEFVSSIIHGVAHCYGGQIKVCPQYELSGSHGKGPVDWAIKVEDMIIAITEAKKEDFDQGVGQNIVQLQASTQCNPRKRKFDSALREDVMFGIVTTGIDWVIIKVVSGGINNGGNNGGNNDNSSVQVQKSSQSPLNLPINGNDLDPVFLKGKLKILFGQLVSIFDEQLELQGQSKRKRII